ncbi:hypothetical protein KUCAC02_030643 [Chaenocephalus aceratus]|uniref:Uncharacterized protein n=1 Tax=Chaenocephalus aceratus TaxID=36190 RepID=A0ACB9XKP6_CHAAC|nr:hypothetical protein KUCAC02_030643 [Chaenocephalus aceratus]
MLAPLLMIQPITVPVQADSSATSIDVRREEQECYGAEQWIHSDPVPKASQSTAGSSGGYAKSIGFMEDGRQADGGFPQQLDSWNGFQYLMCSPRSELVGTQLRGHLHVLFFRPDMLVLQTNAQPRVGGVLLHTVHFLFSHNGLPFCSFTLVKSSSYFLTFADYKDL